MIDGNLQNLKKYATKLTLYPISLDTSIIEKKKTKLQKFDAFLILKYNKFHLLKVRIICWKYRFTDDILVFETKFEAKEKRLYNSKSSMNRYIKKHQNSIFG